MLLPAVPPHQQVDHVRYLFRYAAYLASYIKSTVNFIVINKEVQKNPELIADLFTYIRFFEEAIKYSREPYEKYKAIIDLGLFSSLDKETLRPVKWSCFVIYGV